MTQFVCGIYGFEFTRQFTVDGLSFVPLFSAHDEAYRAARDLDHYHLTGAVVADMFDDDLVFRLEAVLSFIEHLDAVITTPEQLTGATATAQFAKTLKTSRRHNGGGARIMRDVYSAESRPEFIRKTLARLADTSYCEATGYHTLFFKSVETFRQRRPFIEVSYFLLFSGLETYVRNTLVDFDSKDVTQLLVKRLRAMGFDVCHFRKADLMRSMDSYARLRNALFHNGKFKAERPADGLQYNLIDYFSHFSFLVALTVIKATDFDDSHINWDAWIDMQPFK